MVGLHDEGKMDGQIQARLERTPLENCCGDMEKVGSFAHCRQKA